MKIKYTKAQKAEALRLCKLGKPRKEVSEITGININTLKAITRNDRESNQTVNGSAVEEKVEEFIEDNQRIIDSKSTRITTLGQLVKYCRIDLSVWSIDKHIINKWEVGINADGVIETSPLFQVKAWLSKIKPEAIKPVVSPVTINAKYPKMGYIKKSGLKKALIIGDAQIGFTRNMRTGKLTPFQDRRAIDIAFQLLNKYQFNLVIIGGDFLDFSMWSKQFLKKPGFYSTTQPSLVECAWILSVIRQLQPNAEVVYLEGNHEIRPEKAIMEHFVDAYDLRSADNIDGQAVMSIPGLLGLGDMNIEYIGNYPSTEKWINDTTVIRHGDTARKGSGATVSALAREAFYTEIIFHIHRDELVSKTLHNGKGTRTIKQYCPGCVCKIDGTVPGKTARPNWQQGLGILNYDDKDYTNIERVPIENGKAFYRDEIITGKDYTKQLRKDTKHHDKKGNAIEWNY